MFCCTYPSTAQVIHTNSPPKLLRAMLLCPKVAIGETEGSTEGKRKSGWLDGPSTSAKHLRMVNSQASVSEWSRESIARHLAEAEIFRQTRFRIGTGLGYVETPDQPQATIAKPLLNEAANRSNRRMVTEILSTLHCGDPDWSEMTLSEQEAAINSLLPTLR